MTIAPAPGRTEIKRDSLHHRLMWAIAAVLMIPATALTVFKLRAQPLFVDFLVMWTGGRMAIGAPTRIYDFAAIDRAQAWLLGAAAHDRPFPYPPSALLLFSPLGRLDFWIAGLVWTGLTSAVFAAVCARLFPDRRRVVGVMLVLLIPGAVWAAISGQVSFFIGALAVGGTALLRRRPLSAGVLLGIAAVVKPTVLLMAPAALVGGAHWRAIAGAAIGGLMMIGVSMAAFGIEPWAAWLAAALGFLNHILHDPRFATGIITPTGLAARLGSSGGSLMVWRVVFVVIGVVMAALAFRRTDALAPRLTALIGAGLLASPYAMNYETTLLAPGAVLTMLTATTLWARTLSVLAFVALCVASFPNVGAAALLVFLGLSAGAALADQERLRAKTP